MECLPEANASHICINEQTTEELLEYIEFCYTHHCFRYKKRITKEL